MKARTWLFIGFAALIIAVPLYITFSSEDILENGTYYKFRLQGRDPFDPFRGKYLRLNYDFDRLPMDTKVKDGDEVYASIKVGDDGFAYFEKAYRKPPPNGDCLKVKVKYSSESGNRDRRRISVRNRSVERDNESYYVVIEIPKHMGKYFINEDYATKGEIALRANANKAYVGIRVLDGECRMEDLYIDGVPFMEYLKKH